MAEAANQVPNRDVDPALAPSLHFCLALARHIKAAYPAQLSPETWKAVMGKDAPAPSALDIRTIANKYLLPNVAAQARLCAVLEYSPSKWLLEQEMEALGLWSKDEESEEPPPDVYEVALKKNLKGVCFSGGGIRSATFNLGILQALAADKKLGSIDYLSTVSGGGYIHQFLASWIACENLAKVQEQLSPLPAESSRTVWPDPVRWLRRYSNYLTPKKGLLTADTWVAVSIWLRNTILNQIILAAFILFVLLLPHLPLLTQLPFVNFNPAFPSSSSTNGELLPAIAATVLFLFAAFQVGRALKKGRRPIDTPDDRQHNGLGPKRMIGYDGKKVFLLILTPVFLALFLISPFLYRSSFAPFAGNSAQVMASALTPGTPALVVNPPKPPATSSTPAASIPRQPKPLGFIETTKYFFQHGGLAFWKPFQEPLGFVLMAYLLGLALIVLALEWAGPTGIRRLFPLLAAVIAVGTAIGLLHVARLIMVIAALGLSYPNLVRFATVFAPLLLLTVIFISMDLAIGIIGRSMQDGNREWLARVRSLSFLSGFAWLAVVGCSLLGPVLVSLLFHAHSKSFKTAVVGWITTTVGSVFAGKSSATKGPTETSTSTTSALDHLIALGPPVFLVGLMLSNAWLLQTVINALGLTSLASLLLAGAVLLTVTLLFSWRVDINEFSLHAFYRDRIARCYAGASNPDRHPNAFTGLATSDTRLRVVDLLPVRFGNGSTSLWAEPDCKPVYEGPFPIFSTTLNLTFGADLATQERKAAAFAFTPLYCGYDVGWTEGDNSKIQFNGFVPTRSFAYPGGGPHMSTAVAASGAALSPNQGFHTSTAMAFLLTIFNVRLGWWIPNPRNLRTDFMSRLSGPTPLFGLPYLLRELFGQVSDDAPYVSISDGGQFENMGLYELVRRRCRTIVICDAEEDSGFVFEGLGMAIRKCRIDFGVDIDLCLDKLFPDAKTGMSTCSYATGTITYPGGTVHGEPDSDPFVGQVLYIKSTLTGAEPADIRNYKREHPAFPGDATLNQWFTESQFESYRRLGQFIGECDGVSKWLAANL